MVSSGSFPSKLPLTASHEGAGVVAGIGSGVSGFSTGQRVMCPIMAGRCGECTSCRGPDEWKHYCPKENHRGVTIDGAFAEYQLVDARETNVLPDGVDFETAAPLACAGRTIWRAIKTADLKRGQWIALVGSGGGLGHIGIQFAKQLGLKVIGVDAKDGALALSKEAGADVVVDARGGKEEVVKKVQEVVGGGEGVGADASIALADAEDAAALACAITKMHGVMVQVAQPEKVCIPFQEFVFRNVQVKGSLLCSKGEADEMLRSVAKNGLKIKMEKATGLDKVKDLVERVQKGELSGKGVVIVDEKLAKSARKQV